MFPQFGRLHWLSGTERERSVAANPTGTWLANFQCQQESHVRG